MIVIGVDVHKQSLMAPQRRAGRARGKSDPIDALAVARAALREPRLDHPRPGERRLRELKLLVDHRDDLIDARRRAQQRLRWHLHDLDPTPAVPLGALDRAVWLDRLGRRDRKSTRLNSSHITISYAVFCLKKKKKKKIKKIKKKKKKNKQKI